MAMLTGGDAAGRNKRSFFAFFFLILFLCLFRDGYCQRAGIKYLENYSPKDYEKHPQNWAILQDRSGIIYVGNHTGLLIYDGVSWRTIDDIPNKTVYSMAMDENGTIYIGGDSEIGYLAPDENGRLKYISLRDRLDDNEKNFSQVWRTHSTKEGIYFRTKNFLFRRHKGKLNSIRPSEKGYTFRASYYCGGKLYIRHEDIGLIEVKGNSLEPVPGGKIFGDKGIFMMVQYGPDPERLLIGTRNNGFYIYDGTRAIPHPTEVDDYVKENELYHGIRLQSSPGDFVLATLLGGLVIIDSRGRLKETFTISHGLQDDFVHFVFEDMEGNLWLALSSGISKIEYASPISIYNMHTNLRGLVLSVTGHGPGSELYVGTTRGLYYLESDGKFNKIPGIPSQCLSLLSTGGSLLAATNSGLFRLAPHNPAPQEIFPGAVNVLLRSRGEPNRVWAGTNNGVISLYLDSQDRNAQWKEEKRFEKVTQTIRTIVEDKDGNLWLGTQTEGVIHIRFREKERLEPYGAKPYGVDHGLPGGEVNVFWAADHVVFAAANGIYYFEKETETFRPDHKTLGETFAGGPKGNEVFRLAEDNSKNIWVNADKKTFQAVFRENQPFRINRKPFLRIPLTQVNAIYPDPGGDVVYFGIGDGLIRFDKTVKKDYNHHAKTYIRQVVVNGIPIFSGYKTGVNTSKSKHLTYRLPSEDRNILFEFAAPFFENESATQYRYLLEGYEKEWSDWSPEGSKAYNKLNAGVYTFRVKAKNVYDELFTEDDFQFEILTPLYRTPGAFLLYTLVLFLLTYLIGRWRHSFRLEREKQKLGRIVKERTKEIEEKNQTMEAQTLRLKEQAEKLKEMDKIKSRFFANISHEFRTPLTLIMGPLEQKLSESKDHKEQKELNLMLRNSQRLLGLINQLLELSRFESGKMKLRACGQNIISFLKGIIASFEPVTTKSELTLTFRANDENIPLYFDPEKLEEVIFNLLSNAVKFTPPGGKITVTLTQNSNHDENFPSGSVDISVCDTGPGIPRDQLGHIFDRFYQSDITYEHHPKGSGIGLAIAKEVVELHHGKIDVHSSEGKGTEFIIRLPMGKAHLKSDQIVDIPLKPSGHRFPPEIPDARTPAVPPAETIETITDEGKDEGKEIILVVEDSTDVRDYIRGSLEPDYTVVEARDGGEGIRKAREIIPDLVISDIMMPETDGYELCRVLKNDVITSHIPIILLTAKASEENIVEGLETGADDYITKPFSTRILCARVKNLIDLRRQLHRTMDREMTLQPVKISVSPIDKTFLKKLKEVIKENISDPDFNIEQLCKKMDMSQPTIYRKINALTGESPTDFIRSYRLKRGAELLKNNFGSVLEVAFEVGFSSAAYFTKCFKRKFHQLPSTYRETAR
jgi:signal transduction histidine kinase/DNA-binding NarL/FixJ family response regulator/predicted DNA-binding transcriptional regulator AlpA